MIAQVLLLDAQPPGVQMGQERSVPVTLQPSRASGKDGFALVDRPAVEKLATWASFAQKSRDSP
jgi:hypothetical protein